MDDDTHSVEDLRAEIKEMREELDKFTDNFDGEIDDAIATVRSQNAALIKLVKQMVSALESVETTLQQISPGYSPRIDYVITKEKNF